MKPTFDTTIADPLERVRDFWNGFADMSNEDNQGYHDSPFGPSIIPYSAQKLDPKDPSSRGALAVAAFTMVDIPRSMCNRMLNMHGGAVAAAFDMTTSIALAPIAKRTRRPAREREGQQGKGTGADSNEDDDDEEEEEDRYDHFWTMPGVSRSLTCQYLKPVPMGATIRVRCEVTSASRRMAVIRGWMRLVDGSGEEAGEVLATCVHEKVSLAVKL